MTLEQIIEFPVYPSFPYPLETFVSNTISAAAPLFSIYQGVLPSFLLQPIFRWQMLVWLPFCPLNTKPPLHRHLSFLAIVRPLNAKNDSFSATRIISYWQLFWYELLTFGLDNISHTILRSIIEIVDPGSINNFICAFLISMKDKYFEKESENIS